MSDIRLIKKYANRRLYDTITCAYITLDDIKQLVIQHITFKVVDAKTGDDLTQHTLLQIITDQEMHSTPLFTTDMLQEFIRFYNEKSQDAFRESLEQMMKLFITQRDVFSKQWQSYWSMLMGGKK